MVHLPAFSVKKFGQTAIVVTIILRRQLHHLTDQPWFITRNNSRPSLSGSGLAQPYGENIQPNSISNPDHEL
jgi:hypothetical protein